MHSEQQDTATPTRPGPQDDPPRNGRAGLRRWRHHPLAGLVVSFVAVPLSSGIVDHTAMEAMLESAPGGRGQRARLEGFEALGPLSGHEHAVRVREGLNSAVRMAG